MVADELWNFLSMSIPRVIRGGRLDILIRGSLFCWPLLRFCRCSVEEKEAFGCACWARQPRAAHGSV